MDIYAGIGSRKTPNHILSIMRSVAEYLAKKDWILHTGACTGADQAFAEGALKGRGIVNLFLPWSGYEKRWIDGLRGKVNVTVFNQNEHKDAIKSVHDFHPMAHGLKRSVLALHARNYLILDGAKFAICYTPKGKTVGGTGQAIRIMTDRRKNLFNLGNENELQAVLDKL